MQIAFRITSYNVCYTKLLRSEITFEFNSKDVRRKLYHDDLDGYRFQTWYDSFENFYGGKRVDDPVEVLQELRE